MTAGGAGPEMSTGQRASEAADDDAADAADAADADDADDAVASVGQAPPAESLSVLVVADHPNEGKIRRHWGPLAAVAGRTTMVCLNPDESVEGIDYRVPPSVGNRYIGLVLLGLLALREALRGDYDVVASISLFPYGLVALVLGMVFRLPTHLGIIGMDADDHAHAWYGALPRAAFRRFDVVSVPGAHHVDSLVAMGVPEDRVTVLTNAIDTDVYRPDDRAATPTYDFLWVGRFSEEKNPLAFVGALHRLALDGADVRAAMLGTGPLADEVAAAVERAGLDERVDLPGWVDDPSSYYRDASVFVLTSHREGLPLTMLEAMATGVVPVVVPAGSVTDAARHEENALVVPEASPSVLAAAMGRVLEDDALRDRLAAAAPGIRSEYGYPAAREDWRRILQVGVSD